MTSALADRTEELTADFLTDALVAGGHAWKIANVSARAIGTGQMGATYRLELGYEGTAGPPTMIVKLPASDPNARPAVANGYAAEVGFYLALASKVDVRTPRCWYGAISEDRTAFTLLLEDAAAARPGVQVQGCSIPEANAALTNLIGLHAPTWNDESLLERDFLMRAGRKRAAIVGELMSRATETFIGHLRRPLGAEDQRTLQAVSEAIADWQLARATPYALIHGDYRLDNLLFGPNHGEVIAIDWQTAAIGPPLRDVAYFLGTCLEPRDRQANEERLVASYHAALVERGIAYSADECWTDYRLGHLQGPMVTVLGSMYAGRARDDQSEAMFLAMARRSCQAIRDLGSLDLL